MREIYNRDPDDPSYNPYQLETTDPVEICIGQLKMLLLTNKGEVMGDPQFGLNLEDLIFSLNISEYSLKKELDLNLKTYDLKFFQGTLRDIATLDFRISESGGDSPVVSLKIT
jgi:hypothetical protein